MTEPLISVSAAIIVFTAAVLRLNTLHAAQLQINLWRAAEVIGLATVMSGTAGIIGEWFLENADFHAETIVLVGFALIAVGISRAKLCDLIGRLQGWDGVERRQGARRTPCSR